MTTIRDSIDELLTSLRERFTNPLVFAFICSWIAWNWRVVVVLLWTNSANDLNVSIVQYIEDHIEPYRSLGYPLATAALLVLALPVTRALIQIFTAYVNRRGTDSVLAIKGEGGVSVRNYIRLRQDFQARTTLLENVLKQEQTTQEEAQKTKTALLTMEVKASETTNQLAIANNIVYRMRDMKILNGWWRNDYEDTVKKIKGSEIFRIENGKYIIVDVVAARPQNERHMFNIVGFSYYLPQKEMYFVKELTQEQKRLRDPAEHISFNSLQFDSNESVLTGTENGTTLVRYTRVEM